MLWGDGSGYGYRDGWQMMDGGGTVAAGIMMVLLVLVLAGVASALVMALRRPPTTPTLPSVPLEDSARRTLDERFARGEIDEEEYRRRRSVLLET
jgi:putative membrane protein